MTQTNSIEKKAARREWCDTCACHHSEESFQDIHNPKSRNVVEAKWRDMAEMLAVALKFYSNVETFPIPKIDQSRGSAIIVKHPDYFSVARQALEEFSKLSGSDRTQNLGDE